MASFTPYLKGFILSNTFVTTYLKSLGSLKKAWEANFHAKAEAYRDAIGTMTDAQDRAIQYARGCCEISGGEDYTLRCGKKANATVWVFPPNKGGSHGQPNRVAVCTEHRSVILKNDQVERDAIRARRSRYFSNQARTLQVGEHLVDIEGEFEAMRVFLENDYGRYGECPTKEQLVADFENGVISAYEYRVILKRVKRRKKADARLKKMMAAKGIKVD